jgi:hypothetical protein
MIVTSGDLHIIIIPNIGMLIAEARAYFHCN